MAEGESRESKALPIYIWIKVLLYLEYSELKHIRSVSKFLFDCCNERRVQEASFTAPLNQETLELHHQAGDEVELHPALSAYKREINIYEHNEPENFVDWLNDYDKIGRLSFENLKNLGRENAFNPPLDRIRILTEEWDGDSIRKKIKDWVQRPIDNHTGRFLDELEGSEGENEGSDEEKESWEEDEVDQDKEEELLELSREGPRAITVSEIIRFLVIDFKENDRKEVLKEVLVESGQFHWDQIQYDLVLYKVKESLPKLFIDKSGKLSLDLNHIRFALKPDDDYENIPLYGGDEDTYELLMEHHEREKKEREEEARIWAAGAEERKKRNQEQKAEKKRRKAEREKEAAQASGSVQK